MHVANDVSMAAAGHYHSMFVKTDGTLWGMGANNYGQLGYSSIYSTSAPVQVASDVVSVRAGFATSAFIKTDGMLWTVGYGGFGMLGDGSGQNQNSPVCAGAMWC